MPNIEKTIRSLQANNYTVRLFANHEEAADWTTR